MSSPDPSEIEHRSPQDAAALLASAEQASADSAFATEAPKRFLFALAFISAAIFSLHGVISTELWYWSFVLYLPLIAWYSLWTRKHPKPRPALRHSGKYMLGVFAMIAATQFSNFWVPQTWPGAGAKLVALFAVLSGILWAMRSETIKSRIKDGNEHAR